MKIDKTTAVAVMVLAMSVIPALSQTYNYFYPGGALFGSATVQSVNLASGSYIAGNLPVTNLNSGIGANSSTVWCGNATWCTPPGGGGGSLANPTATIGLSAVNGGASTGMRSDGAPALSQAIVPTWSNKHTFNGSVLVNAFSGSSGSLEVLGAANNYAEKVIGSGTTGQSLGLYIGAGTTSADVALQVSNAASTSDFFTIAGNGGVALAGQANEGLGTLNAVGVYVASYKTPKFAFASAVFGIASCSYSGSQYVVSCTHTSTGQYTFVLTTGLYTATNSYACTASTQGSNESAATNNNSATNLTVYTYSISSGGLADGTFNLTCMGN